MNHVDLAPEIIRHYLPYIKFRREMQIEQRGNFEEKYPEDAITAFLVSGIQYFDRYILIARKFELLTYKPFRSYSNGEAVIFNPRIPNRRYLIGADVATGKLSGKDLDFCAAVVIDLETGEEMAAYKAHVTPQQFAFDLEDLGRYYNVAHIAVERTGDGGTTILTLAGDCRYTNLYKHREWWKRGNEKKVIDYEGLPTTIKTRPIALNFLNRFVMEHPDLLWDMKFLDEALVFVRDEKGIPKAAVGAHDDTVSCRWIAHYVRQVMLGYYDPLQKTVGGRVTYTNSAQLVQE